MQVQELPPQAGISFALIDGARHFRAMDVGEKELPWERPPGSEDKPNGVAQMALTAFREKHPDFAPINLRKGVSRTGNYLPEPALEPVRRFLRAEERAVRARYFAVLAARNKPAVPAPLPSNMRQLPDFILRPGVFVVAFELELTHDGRKVTVIRYDGRHWLSLRDVSLAISDSPGASTNVAAHYGKLEGEAIKVRRPGKHGGKGAYAPVCELDKAIEAVCNADPRRVESLRADVKSMVYANGSIDEFPSAKPKASTPAAAPKASTPAAAPKPVEPPKLLASSAMTEGQERELESALSTLDDAIPDDEIVTPAPSVALVPVPAKELSRGEQLFNWVQEDHEAIHELLPYVREVLCENEILRAERAASVQTIQMFGEILRENSAALARANALLEARS